MTDPESAHPIDQPVQPPAEETLAVIIEARHASVIQRAAALGDRVVQRVLADTMPDLTRFF